MNEKGDVLQHGYVGQLKGMKQILWERGLREEKLGDRAKALVAQCEDFAAEKSTLEELLISTSDVILMSPKGHPELAGKGVEFSWGYPKRGFRSKNDCKAKNLHANVVVARSQATLPLPRVRKFARGAREYRRAYHVGSTHAEIEKSKEQQKTHRCTMWSD